VRRLDDRDLAALERIGRNLVDRMGKVDICLRATPTFQHVPVAHPLVEMLDGVTGGASGTERPIRAASEKSRRDQLSPPDAHLLSTETAPGSAISPGVCTGGRDRTTVIRPDGEHEGHLRGPSNTERVPARPASTHPRTIRNP